MSTWEVKWEKLMLYIQGEVQGAVAAEDVQFVTVLSVMYS